MRGRSSIAPGAAAPGSRCVQRRREAATSTTSRKKGEDRTREAYGAKTWERLVAAKRKYDPQNLFRMNQNIDPRG